jgi:hypothetical protein
MIRSIEVCLGESRELEETMVQFNQVCQQMMDWAFVNKECDKLIMHAVHYHRLRREFPELRSGLIQKARDIACKSYQYGGFERRSFRGTFQSVHYDQRTLKVYLRSEYVSLSTVRGRKNIHFI